jgi:hypothetical protein
LGRNKGNVLVPDTALHISSGQLGEICGEEKGGTCA